MSDGGTGQKPENPVTVVIDGREIVAEKGEILLQVALDNGIEIPHYCYHPKLSIDGSCRMCQVKIERAPKLAIACNAPVVDGMVVDTTCDEVAQARRGVMELLLINHPLDCPICDQAGECYLQDYSYGYGREDARTSSPRRKGLKRHAIGPRVVFDEERCILCRRCVRFTSEISKTEELKVFGIGDHSHIGALPGAPLDNEYSINTADICPVGALLSADFHHKRRVWFLEETPTVCPSCSKGCNVKIGMYKNEIQRLVPRRNDDVNETWMCDHGRLNYGYAQDETRVRAAVVRGAEASNGSAPGVPTDQALDEVAARLRAVIDEHGAEAVGILGSGRLTNEEQYHLAALARDSIGTPHVGVVVPLGEADGFLIQAEKVANARGAREMGVVPGDGGKDVAAIVAAAGERGHPGFVRDRQWRSRGGGRGRGASGRSRHRRDTHRPGCERFGLDGTGFGGSAGTGVGRERRNLHQPRRPRAAPPASHEPGRRLVLRWWAVHAARRAPRGQRPGRGALRCARHPGRNLGEGPGVRGHELRAAGKPGRTCRRGGDAGAGPERGRLGPGRAGRKAILMAVRVVKVDREALVKAGRPLRGARHPRRVGP